LALLPVYCNILPVSSHLSHLCFRLENWQFEEWGSQVTVVSSDMREWVAPEKADIIVSELLGSFADNELSPECLDGAQHFLKGDSRLRWMKGVMVGWAATWVKGTWFRGKWVGLESNHMTESYCLLH
jgi:hypothetical protein